jgi:hypothetical protein
VQVRDCEPVPLPHEKVQEPQPLQQEACVRSHLDHDDQPPFTTDQENKENARVSQCKEKDNLEMVLSGRAPAKLEMNEMAATYRV